MTSYSLARGGKPERRSQQKHELSDLESLWLRQWKGLITTEIPPHDEWVCEGLFKYFKEEDFLLIAGRDGFDKERVRFVPHLDAPMIAYGIHKPDPDVAHYLVFRRRKVVEQEMRQWEEEFLERILTYRRV